MIQAKFNGHTNLTIQQYKENMAYYDSMFLTRNLKEQLWLVIPTCIVLLFVHHGLVLSPMILAFWFSAARRSTKREVERYKTLDRQMNKMCAFALWLEENPEDTITVKEFLDELNLYNSKMERYLKEGRITQEWKNICDKPYQYQKHVLDMCKCGDVWEMNQRVPNHEVFKGRLSMADLRPSKIKVYAENYTEYKGAPDLFKTETSKERFNRIKNEIHKEVEEITNMSFGSDNNDDQKDSKSLLGIDE